MLIVIKQSLYVILLLCAIGSGAQEKRPNILLVLCDDLGYADVGFNGSSDIILLR